MDVDALIYGVVYQPMRGRFIVERKDRFILIEAKKPGEVMLTGQKLCLQAVSKLPRWNVVVLVIDGDIPESYTIVNNGHFGPTISTDRERFSELISRWFHRVNGNGEHTLGGSHAYPGGY